ncbi:hypothetical protein ABZ499_21925 [Streptomyces sp. NPDC019990]
MCYPPCGPERVPAASRRWKFPPGTEAERLALDEELAELLDR